jgi:hypothetical protein
MTFELTFIDGRAEIIAGADTYEQEGPMISARPSIKVSSKVMRRN